MRLFNYTDIKEMYNVQAKNIHISTPMIPTQTTEAVKITEAMKPLCK